MIENESRSLGVTEEWVLAKQNELLEQVDYDDNTA